MLLVTTVFATITSHNVRSEKGLLKMVTSECSVRLVKPLLAERPVSFVLYNVHY